MPLFVAKLPKVYLSTYQNVFLSQQYDTCNKISKTEFSKLQSCKADAASCHFALHVHPVLKYLQTLESIRSLGAQVPVWFFI